MLSFINSIRSRDEAQPTFMEVVLAYPGFHIMTIFHPVAHFLWGLNLRALARLWAYAGRFFTGIEIHPAAKIGKNLFIDHGTGVVIGQTAVVGDGCRFYHGVTLGGKGGDAQGSRRHPSIGDNVIVGANALVLGAIAVGDGARVGAGAVVTSDVPPGVTAIGNPARMIEKAAPPGHCCYGLPEGPVEDPLAASVNHLARELDALKAGVQDHWDI